MEKIILCANANVGKSTYFNRLTKGNARVGNWLGTTAKVETKKITLQGKETLVVDLPGTHSLFPYAQDEQVTVDYVNKNLDGKFVNIVDINNLRRNLFLTLELIEKGLKLQIIVNFGKKFKGHLDVAGLSNKLDVEVSYMGQQLKEFKKSKLNVPPSAEGKHKLIDSILADCYTKKSKYPYGLSKWDRVLLNKYAALPIFLIVAVIVFAITFVVFPFIFSLPTNFILKWLSAVSSSYFYQEVIFSTFKAVVQFLPQILGMLFCVYVLENSGYISRLAFLVDDFFVKIGLSGKSVFPMLLSFGCASMAVDFVGTIKDKSAQIKTAASLSILPCSAKLPIVLVVLSLLVGREKAFFAIVAVFFVLIVLSLVFVAFLDKGVFKSKREEQSVLEFPQLRIPRLGVVCKNASNGASEFLYRIVGIVLVANMVLYLMQRININIGFLAPVFAPIGFNVQVAVVALLFGIIAKELILTTAFVGATSLAGVLSPPALIAFLMFSLLYTPCAHTIFGINERFGAKVTTQIVWRQFIFAYVIAGISFLVFGGRSIVFVAMLFMIGILAVLMPKKRCPRKRC